MHRSVLVLSLFFAHCDPALFENRDAARRLVASLETDFSHAVEASSHATLANTDEASQSAATEARQARAAITRDIEALRIRLEALAFAPEQRLLADFAAKFTAYEVLDESMLAVHGEVVALSRENTNVRAVELTLGQKRTLTASCRETLRALSTALDERVAGGSR